jgi:hypothetical protein
LAGEPFDVWSGRMRDAKGRFVRVAASVLHEGAERAEARAKQYAPVVTGELRASIVGGVEGLGTGRGVGGGRMFLTAPRKYAPIEFGSVRGHRAQRFLERGMMDTLDELEEQMGDALEGAFAGPVGHIGPRFSGRSR